MLYTILRARSCTLSTFLALEALQKCHIRWQYVKYGNIEDLYKSNFASVGISFLNLERTPTLWLAFIRSSLMCLLNKRCSSMLTPRGLMSAVLSITCALIVVLREQNLPQSKNWRHSGLTMKDHHITRATAFKNQSAIPKVACAQTKLNSDWTPNQSLVIVCTQAIPRATFRCQPKTKNKNDKNDKKKKKKDRRKKEGVRYRIRNQRHRLHATSPYHYNTQNNWELCVKSLKFNTRITNVFIQRFSSYFKAVGPNRFHFLCKTLLPSKCIAKSIF